MIGKVELENLPVILLAAKRARKMVVLNELVSRSYAMRRQDVMSHSYALQEILELYPFLKEPDQVFYNIVMQHPPPPILICMYSHKQVSCYEKSYVCKLLLEQTMDHQDNCTGPSGRRE